MAEEKVRCLAHDGDRYRCELDAGHGGDHETCRVRWGHGLVDRTFADADWARLGVALGRTAVEMAKATPAEVAGWVEALRPADPEAARLRGAIDKALATFAEYEHDPGRAMNNMRWALREAVEGAAAPADPLREAVCDALGIDPGTPGDEIVRAVRDLRERAEAAPKADPPGRLHARVSEQNAEIDRLRARVAKLEADVVEVEADRDGWRKAWHEKAGAPDLADRVAAVEARLAVLEATAAKVGRRDIKPENEGATGWRCLDCDADLRPGEATGAKCADCAPGPKGPPVAGPALVYHPALPVDPEADALVEAYAAERERANPLPRRRLVDPEPIAAEVERALAMLAEVGFVGENGKRLAAVEATLEALAARLSGEAPADVVRREVNPESDDEGDHPDGAIEALARDNVPWVRRLAREVKRRREAAEAKQALGLLRTGLRKMHDDDGERGPGWLYEVERALERLAHGPRAEAPAAPPPACAKCHDTGEVIGSIDPKGWSLKVPCPSCGGRKDAPGAP